MNLHNLDLGLGRFLEVHLCLVLNGPISLEPLESNARWLIELWPILNTRMNLLVGSSGHSLTNRTNELVSSARLLFRYRKVVQTAFGGPKHYR